MQQNTWFIPEGLEDLLPAQAEKLEFYRRKLINEFSATGYQLVLPPIAEFTDALLTGTASQMAVDTCRFTDQESGKMMGVRSDLTPQVARIVANRMKSSDSIQRLCYVAEVLKTRNNKAKGSRSPIQAGVELFGHSGVESDIEVIKVMLSSLKSIGLEELTLSLGHVSFVDELIRLATLNGQQSSELIDILQRKAIPEYKAFVETLALTPMLQDAFDQLLSLTGSAEDVLQKADKVLSPLSDLMQSNIEALSELVKYFTLESNIDVHMDLADLRGYQYHTGIIFSCYAAGRKMYLLAKGGRYDNATSAFGDSMPATGFSMDLRGALDLLPELEKSTKTTVYAPIKASVSLNNAIQSLKEEGRTVCYYYEDEELPEGAEVLTLSSDEWIIK